MTQVRLLPTNPFIPSPAAALYFAFMDFRLYLYDECEVCTAERHRMIVSMFVIITSVRTKLP